MNSIQLRFIRITLTGWLVVAFLYSALYWLLPFTYGQLVALYMLAALCYGLRYFSGE